MKSLGGSVAIVTGASKGFGREIALQLAAEGVKVVAAARSTESLAALVDEIEAAGGTAVARAVDLRDPQQCAALVDWTAAKMGALDILVNNAGLGHWGAVETMTDAEWRETMEVNVDAIFYLCRAAIGPMRKQGSGHIVNIASVAGRRGAPYMAAYAASKAAVIVFSEGLSGELKKDGIQVSIVSPGTGASDFRASHTKRPMDGSLTDPDRMLVPGDVASAVVWTLKSSQHVQLVHTIVEPRG